MKSVPDGTDAAQASAIAAVLEQVEREHDVTIVWAIESGSRAWGFPSPDSDYDCRFIYVRRLDHYLSPWQRRDVIETPFENDLDVNGWDLAKALKLVLKGNAVVIEWLSSPIVYRGDAEFRDDLRAFAARHARRERIGRHYLHLGERQRRTYFGEGKQVELKKIFYALRPAAALRWLRLHPDSALPPMAFPRLMEECEPPPAVAKIAADLIRQKAVTRELGVAPLPGPVAEFVDAEFAEGAVAFENKGEPTADAARQDAERLFRQWVSRCSEGARR